MHDDVLRDFAQRLAAKVALAKADHDTSDDALFAIGELMHEAKRDPAGWLEANRYRGRTQAPQPTRVLPDAADIYRRRREQTGERDR